MSCLGVHFSLSVVEVQQLYRIEIECERIAYLHEVIEEEAFHEHPEWKAESDRAWDAMHRTLTNGELTWNGGEYPLSYVVLGGESLCPESDFIMSLKSPDQVRDVALALPQVSETEFRQRYFAIDPISYGRPVTEDDFAYTWEWFQEIREFWLRAAAEGRYVLFTADQ